jgi:hypothetical protein
MVVNFEMKVPDVGSPGNNASKHTETVSLLNK